ncbi:L,D-transpeptidase family protein [Pedobacter cryoconitis]|uniref:Murein L,D-transpeptidase YcbB/YkuD n=1 Tax=Pedobacter cryoconitis TaxID=188932 RepID=A0A7X0MIK4_9SPHI|nr:L,D-transpeptidase family protein [Pedobacter cryoconitis]MBB6498528.1 murein L,D-transpeptidase YcbB/YkuD [Pedobacter cryoconitis]
MVFAISHSRQRHPFLLVLLIAMISMLFCLSCKIKKPATTAVITTNPVIVNPVKTDEQDGARQEEFKRILFTKFSGSVYLEQINAFYKENNYKPVLIRKFFPDRQLLIFAGYLMNTGRHGLDPELFSAGVIKKKLDSIYSINNLTIPDTSQNITELEFSVANALISYSKALQFGFTNPAKVYAHYTSVNLIPDSNYIPQVLKVSNLKDYLENLQPNGIQYKALQNALSSVEQSAAVNKDIQYQTIVVNMERLRWKDRPAGEKIVVVNIADFSLDVIDKRKVVLHMKVCVGESGERETPQLSSQIYSVQVNPIWNIPQSIAKNETSKQAAEDRYYLANNNINVYQKGKLIANPESIDWSEVDVSSYSFKQQPGGKNALGKIKFLFNNSSSIYLHDTPVQSAFRKKIRAVSHGCVRVEKPMELAYALFGKVEKYEQVKRAMDSGYPRAKYIGLPKKIPIWLTYYTAWSDDKGKIQFCRDIYGLDSVLYAHLKWNNLAEKNQ